MVGLWAQDPIYRAYQNLTSTHTPPTEGWYLSQPSPPSLPDGLDGTLYATINDIEIDDNIDFQHSSINTPSARLQNVTPNTKPKTPAIAYEEALTDDVHHSITPALKLKHLNIETFYNNPNAPRWIKYALKTPSADKLPMIAIVIDDLGLDLRRTKATLNLPGPLTAAFIPYSKHLKRQTDLARQQGHELMVHLPMEPLNPKINAGPHHLSERFSENELIERIYWNLERFDGYVGVNNHMGSKATSNPKVMSALMTELRRRELLFLDSRTNPKSLGPSLADKEGVPYTERNVFLDNENEKQAVLNQLKKLERVARKTGTAVGIGHPRDGTIAALKEWIPEARKNGFNLVPISRIVLQRKHLG